MTEIKWKGKQSYIKDLSEFMDLRIEFVETVYDPEDLTDDKYITNRMITENSQFECLHVGRLEIFLSFTFIHLLRLIVATPLFFMEF